MPVFPTPYIKILFLHLQGIVLIPILKTLFNSKISKILLTKNKFTISDIEKTIYINKGYINVALRILRSSNLLKYNHLGITK